jgi:hypothetical protein
MDDLELLSIKYCEVLIKNERLTNKVTVLEEDKRNVDAGLVRLTNYINSQERIPKNIKKRLNELLFAIS